MPNTTPERWIKVSETRPPLDTEVMTRIEDEKGIRNEQTLKLHNNLWWTPDMGMYVYYRPTHWRPL